MACRLVFNNINTKKVKCDGVCVCVERERGEGRIQWNEYRNKTKIYFLILLGHLRTLCPGCRHAPQSRKHLAGGLSLMEEVVVLKMESGKVL